MYYDIAKDEEIKRQREAYLRLKEKLRALDENNKVHPEFEALEKINEMEMELIYLQSKIKSYEDWFAIARKFLHVPDSQTTFR